MTCSNLIENGQCQALISINRINYSSQNIAQKNIISSAADQTHVVGPCPFKDTAGKLEPIKVGNHDQDPCPVAVANSEAYLYHFNDSYHLLIHFLHMLNGDPMEKEEVEHFFSRR